MVVNFFLKSRKSFVVLIVATWNQIVDELIRLNEEVFVVPASISIVFMIFVAIVISCPVFLK